MIFFQKDRETRQDTQIYELWTFVWTFVIDNMWLCSNVEIKYVYYFYFKFSSSNYRQL